MAQQVNNTYGNLANIFSSVYGALDNPADKQKADANSLREQGDPFGKARGYYQSLLQQTYTDPKAFFDQQYKPMDDVFYRDLKSKAAADGRSTDSMRMGLSREAQFQNYLNNTRQQLGQFAGAGIDPAAAMQAYQNMMGQAYKTQEKSQAGIGQLLGLLTQNNGENAKTLWNAGSNAVDWLSNLWNEDGELAYDGAGSVDWGGGDAINWQNYDSSSDNYVMQDQQNYDWENFNSGNSGGSWF